MNLSVDDRLLSKQKWLDRAEVVDAWRVVPRLLIFGFCAWFAYQTYYLITWYTNLPIAAQTTQASSFCFGCFTAMSGMGGYVFKTYAGGGRNWADQSSVTQTTTQTTVAK